MVSLLIYPLAKYSTRFRLWIARLVSMRALLAFHVYAGVFGAFLAILHTGHKYQSPLGIALVISMLVVVVTGFVGRYYLPQTSTDLREAQSRLATLRSAYDRTVVTLARRQASEDEAGTRQRVGTSGGSDLRSSSTVLRISNMPSGPAKR